MTDDGKILLHGPSLSILVLGHVRNLGINFELNITQVTFYATKLCDLRYGTILMTGIKECLAYTLKS